jgi:NTP pyrophosphatase (non-canonical NTP hydrolase)
MSGAPDSPDQSLTLDEYQTQSAATDLEGKRDDPMTPLLGLAGEVGALIAEYKKKRRDDGIAYAGFDEVVKTELGDILWYLASLARRVDVRLSDVAHINLEKTRARWLAPDPDRRMSMDDGFQDSQRLPRRFTAQFSSYTDESGIRKAKIQIEGEEVGDDVDDNARYADGYRFHDAFHLSYLAVLGWSPILRALLRRKRKGDPATDRAEDGARACATEEAIAALVFALAKPYNYFAGAERVDDTILDAVHAVVADLEVSRSTKAEWERAILSGFAVWRALNEAEAGVVEVDMDAGTIELTG